MKELLALKRALRARKPRFVRDEHGKRKEVGASWRRPRGLCNKSRSNLFGQPLRVKKGYKMPSLVRGLLRTGHQPFHITSLASVQQIDEKKHVAVIARTVGQRKKLIIIEALLKKGCTINNMKDPKNYLERVKKTLADRQKTAKTSSAKPTPAPTEKKDVTKDAPKELPKETPEKTKEDEKKELDKVLSKRQ